MSLEARNGVSLHVQRLGESGSPVIFLHGLFVGSMASWYFTAAPELAKKHRVLLYDLRGHGKSERAASGYDVATMTSDLAALAEDFGDEPLTLVGHSYGAVVALSFAIRHPQRVRKLVLVDAPLPPSKLEELNAFVRKSPEEMISALPADLAGALARGGRQARRLAEILHFMAKNTTLIADVRRAEDIPDSALASLTCETLCIYGTRSSCLTVGERIAKTIPSARLVTIAGGHFLPLEAPAELAREVASFVDGSETQSRAMGEIVSRGAKLHYERLGDGDREAVVFVHGLVMDNLASFYFSVANAISEKYDVVLYDLRGHGKSQRMPDGYTVSGMVDDLLAIIRGNSSKSVHLVGNSFGGVVAVSFALAHPDMVKSIILIDAHLGDSGFADQMADTLSLQGDERDRQIAKSFEHWLGRHSERKRNRLAEHAQDLVARTTLIDDIRSTPPISEKDLRRLNVPLLALYGQSSDLRERSEKLLAAAPNVTIKIFEGCSHAILWEATARLRDEMAIFLGQNAHGEKS